MKPKPTILIAATLALAVPAIGLGAALPPVTIKLRAQMDARQVTVPRKPVGNVAHATGTFTGTLTRRNNRWRLSWRITYSKLATPTIVIADVHYGKPHHFGPIIVRLCGPCKSGASGSKPVTGLNARQMRSGYAFITLITNKNPNGEIRGQIRSRVA